MPNKDLVLTPKLSIIIPALNESKIIPELAAEIDRAFKASGHDSYEVIWVDDGSKDDSIKVLREINKKFPKQKFVALMRSIGQSGALMAGIDKAKGKFIATLDGDGQDDPADLPRMEQMLEDQELDLVVGWRTNRWKGNFFRRIPSIIANLIISRAFRTQGLHDTGCAVKVGKREIFKEIKLYGELHRFITYIAADLGARIGELKIKNRKRKHGKSNYNLKRTMTVIMDILNLKFVMMKKTTPIQVVGPLAFLLFGISFLSGLVTMYMKFWQNVDITGNPMFMIAVLMFLTATQFIFYGLLGELIIRTYYENGTTTRYMVRESSDTQKDLCQI